MSATLYLTTPKVRETALDWIRRAPEGSVLTFTRPDEKRRSNPQNDRFHGMVRDVAKQLTYHGMKLNETDWKAIFLDAWRRDTRLVPALDGTAMVPLRPHISILKSHEAADLITIVQAFGDQEGVKFKADQILEDSYK